MLLSVENLRVRYRNGALGVTDSSLRVDAGKIVALFGANGAGKTTTLRAIGGFLRTEGARVTEGRIMFDGTDITNWEPHRTAALGIATVVERRKIFANLSVRDNLLALGPRQLGLNRKDKLERVFDLFPILQEKLHQPAGRLSGGQQQMLAVSRGLMCDPKFLMIDEVTLGLHPSMHPVLYNAVRRIADEGAAVLVVDESAASALKVVDYCYLLSGGRLRDEGEPAKFQGAELLAAGYVGDA
jgi:branched-chain amino acid transport system ATP-binding protein